MEVKFKSKWFEKCIRDYLGINDRAVTDEDLRVIKYLYVTTTDSYEIGFGSGDLPKKFEFSDCGDEWSFCCLDDTSSYDNIEEFIDIRDWGEQKEISLKRDFVEKQMQRDFEEFEEDVDETAMQEFESSVKKYVAEEDDFKGLERDEKTYDYGILSPDDFSYLKGLEVVRFMSCETEIHSLKFLNGLTKLRVLELGQVSLNTLEGIEELIGLEKLCIWSN